MNLMYTLLRQVFYGPAKMNIASILRERYPYIVCKLKCRHTVYIHFLYCLHGNVYLLLCIHLFHMCNVFFGDLKSWHAPTHTHAHMHAYRWTRQDAQRTTWGRTAVCSSPAVFLFSGMSSRLFPRVLVCDIHFFSYLSYTPPLIFSLSFSCPLLGRAILSYVVIASYSTFHLFDLIFCLLHLSLRFSCALRV